MDAALAALPDDVDALKAALLAARAETAIVLAEQSSNRALIAHLKLQIENFNRDRFGPHSARTARLLEQMELQPEELEATATEDELTTTVAGLTRARPARRPFPEHLPRERVLVPGPVACACCGGTRLSKLGEDITETLEVVPRSWKVIQHAREKFSCRDCERISQPPAPSASTSRSTAKPNATVARAFSLSTLADQVGACTTVLMPLFYRLQAHVMAAERLHGDDTTVPVLARGKTDIARLWTYVRDDRPFGGPAPPGAVFHYSHDRGGEHPQGHLAGYSGILQADAYGGYGKLYEPSRKPGPILEAACWAHARRKFFVLADVAGSARRAAQGKGPAALSPTCLEAVRHIDALFDIERNINGRPVDARQAARQVLSAPFVADLHRWLSEQRMRLARGNDVARALDYLLKRWPAFTGFLDDGRICISNNAEERALRSIALGRKSWLFCGSDRGGQRAAVMYSLIVTAKMNDADPQAWLADVLARIAGHPVQRLDDLLPWNWAAAKAENVDQVA
eukprot:gene1367-1385_t